MWTAEQLLAVIRQAGHKPRYQSSKDEDWPSVLDEPADLVAVAGGDGTVAKVARRLVQREIPLTILPLGTANNIYKTLYAPTPIGNLIAGWTTAHRRSCDLGIARGPWGESYFIESFGIGLLAQLMSANDGHDSPVPDPISEPSAFCRQSAKLCAGYSASRLKIIIDGQDVSGDYLLLEAMNTKFIGTNLCLAPEADVNDGLLDLVLLPPEDRDRFAAYLAARAQQLQESAPLPVHKGKQVHIEFQTRDVHVDDQVYPRDSLSLATPSIAEVNIEGSALEFLVPIRT
jgi:diacylglycerol kinase (ATP)